MKDASAATIQTMSGAANLKQRYTTALWNLLLGYPINYAYAQADKRQLETTPEELASALQAVAAEAASKQSAAYAVASAVADFGKASAHMLKTGQSIPHSEVVQLQRSVQNALEKKAEVDAGKQLLLILSSLTNTVHHAFSSAETTPEAFETLLQLHANSIVALANILILLARSKQLEEEIAAAESTAAPQRVGNPISSGYNWWRKIRHKLPYFKRLCLGDVCYDESLVRFYQVAPKLTTADLELLPGLDDSVKQAPISFSLERTIPCRTQNIQSLEGVAEAGVYYHTKTFCTVKPMGQLYEYRVPSDQRKYVQVHTNAVVCLCLHLCFKQCEQACPLDVAALLNLKWSNDGSVPYRLSVAGMRQTVDLYFSFTKSSIDRKDRCGNPRMACLAAISKLRVYVPFNHM